MTKIFKVMEAIFVPPSERPNGQKSAILFGATQGWSQNWCEGAMHADAAPPSPEIIWAPGFCPAPPVLQQPPAVNMRPIPVRVRLSTSWGEAKLERVAAVVVLVLRESESLDSPVVGKLPLGAEAFVVERLQLGEVTRLLLTANERTTRPLGWITGSKGKQKYVLYGPSPAPARPGWVPGFHTSLTAPSTAIQEPSYSKGTAYAAHASPCATPASSPHGRRSARPAASPASTPSSSPQSSPHGRRSARSAASPASTPSSSPHGRRSGRSLNSEPPTSSLVLATVLSSSGSAFGSIPRGAVNV